MTRLLYTVLLILPTCALVSASTYCVSPSGNDTSGDGSPSNPWLTLQNASLKALAGDTVIAAPGNYLGFRVYNSGTADAWINFIAQPGATITAGDNWNDGITVGSVSYVRISGFGVSNARSYGVRIYSAQHIEMTDLAVDSNASGGFSIQTGSDVTIRHCTARNTTGGAGISASGTCSGLNLLGNSVYGNSAQGVVLSGSSSPVTGCRIEGNSIHDNTQTGLQLNGVQNSVLQNNLLYRCNPTACVLLAKDGSGNASSGNAIVNNTIAPYGGTLLKLDVGSVNTRLYNNLFVDTGSSTPADISIDSSCMAGLASDYNGYFCTIANQNPLQWGQATGLDAHSILCSKDVFVNAAGSGFGLQPHSAAVNVASSLYAPADDILSHTRPVGSGPDLGAYELVLLGDANNDGVVNFKDYLRVESGFGRSGASWECGDFNGDGAVSYADYLCVESAFGQNIPEPTTLVLLATAGGAIVRRRRRAV